MSLLASVALVVVGLVLVVASAEKLVEGLVDTSRGFGVSAFVLSVVFLGFDPENLAVGAAGTWEGVAGFALGSIIGAYMVAVALAFGVTALVAPMEIRAPKPILALAPVAVLLAGALALDGTLSRTDGVVLLVGYAAAVVFVGYLGRRGVTVEPGGEVAEALEEEPRPSSPGDGWEGWRGCCCCSTPPSWAGGHTCTASGEPPYPAAPRPPGRSAPSSAVPARRTPAGGFLLDSGDENVPA